MRSTFTTTSKAVPALALTVALIAGGAFAQQSPPKAAKKAATGMMSGSMADHCKQMMSMHTQMAADIRRWTRPSIRKWLP